MKDTVIRKTSGMMAQLISELTTNFEVMGLKLREQIAKAIISKGGSWVSIAFLFRDLKDDGKAYSDSKMMLASFKSDNSFFKRYSYFIIKNKEEALKVCNLIKEWFNI
jgi:hypothetical protein